MIAVAANMQFAIEPLIHDFTETTGIQCEPILSSSGKLTAQIIEGAPYDVFISANMKYPNELFKNNLTNSQPAIYAHGKLVLWSADKQITPSFYFLKNNSLKHIALANPKTAPYGSAAIEVLKHYDLLEKLKNKLVYGESIAQTNQFIMSQAADIGFTAKSVVLSPQVKGKGNWIDIDPAIYSPIEQGIVILKNSKKQKEAELLFNYLFSKKGKRILEEYGYAVDF